MPDELVTNIITGMKLKRPLTEFRLLALIFHLFHSSNYTCSVNYFYKKLFAFKNNISLNH